MTNFIGDCKRHSWNLLGCAVIFAVICAFSVGVNFTLGGDSVYYWTVFEPLFKGQPVEVWRGYVFPLYAGVMNKLGGGGFGFFIFFNCLIHAFMFMYIIPFVANGGKTDLSLKCAAKSVANFLLIFILFRGLFIHPLSDTYALYMSLLGALFMIKLNAADTDAKRLAACFWCGFFVYLAYNIRTIYLYAGMASLVLALVFIRKLNLQKAKTALCVLSLALGLAAASLPQVILNYKYNRAEYASTLMFIKNKTNKGKISPFVPTAGLMLAQCEWGMEVQRYDTYLGKLAGGTEQENLQMYFVDPVGKKLVEGAHLAKQAHDSKLHGLLYLAAHPFEMVGLYYRHFANLLFPCYPNQYVMKINNNKLAYAIICLLLVFVFALSLVLRAFCKKSFFLWFLPALVACAFILPGQVECRFFLAVFVLMTSGLFYNTDAKALWAKTKANALTVAVVFVFFAAAMVSQWTMFLMSESELPVYILGK